MITAPYGVRERRTCTGRSAIATRVRVADRLRQYLEEHYASAIRLTTLADVAGLSPWYVARIFRARVGVPPHAYLLQVRLSRAQALLALGWPPARVALATGFSDQSHLIRHFKRALGVTPGEHRRQLDARYPSRSSA